MSTRSYKVNVNALKKLRAQHGFTQAEAAQKLGYKSARSWSRYENGGRIRGNALYKIAVAFGVEAYELSPDIEPPIITKPQPRHIDLDADPARAREIEDTVARPPGTETSILDLAKPATGGLINYGEASCGQTAGLVRENGSAYHEQMPGHLAVVTVRGNSMEPVVMSGQRVLFDTRASLCNGDLALVRLRDGDILCKRWYRSEKLGVITLISQNDGEHAPITVGEDDVLESYRVMGVLF